MLLVLWLLGLLVFAFFHQHPELTVRSGDTALFQFISTQLPSPLPGLVIAGMLAAVISTLNAVFNSMAIVYVKELHQRYFDREMIDRARENGLICNVFWSDDADEAREFLDSGIDVILTNDYQRVRCAADEWRAAHARTL